MAGRIGYRVVVFAVGLMWLCGFATAETINATATPRVSQFMYAMTDASNNNRAYSTLSNACAARSVRENNQPVWTVGDFANTCKCSGSGCPYNGYHSSVGTGNTCSANGQIWGGGCTEYSCPSSQNWTLIGTSCTRPDCASYQIRNASTGVCGCPEGKNEVSGSCVTACPAGYHNSVPDNGQCIADCVGRQVQSTSGECTCAVTSGMVSVTYAAAKERCIGGCSVSWGAGVVNPVDAAKYVAGLVSATGVSGYYYISFNGATCSPATTLIPADISMVPKDTSGTAADGVTADAKNKPETNQSSEACAAVGGSWGVYNGVAKCLTDTSNRMAPVTVNKKSSTTQNPDGSSVITTETTTSYKDPVTGELRARTDSSTTNKDSGGNVTGTGGSVTTGSGGGTGNGSAGESSDLCKNNPGLDLCNDRLNKEETQKKVHDVLESLAQGGFEDFDKVKNAKQSIESDDALKVETDKFEQAADGTVDSVSSQKSSWETAMQSGWFDPIPAGSCAPLTAQIGPWFWTIDICPTAEKIAGISEYVLWLGFVIGVFVMFTGGMVRM